MKTIFIAVLTMLIQTLAANAFDQSETGVPDLGSIECHNAAGDYLHIYAAKAITGRAILASNRKRAREYKVDFTSHTPTLTQENLQHIPIQINFSVDDNGEHEVEVHTLRFGKHTITMQCKRYDWRESPLNQ